MGKCRRMLEHTESMPHVAATAATAASSAARLAGSSRSSETESPTMFFEPPPPRISVSSFRSVSHSFAGAGHRNFFHKPKTLIKLMQFVRVRERLCRAQTRAHNSESGGVCMCLRACQTEDKLASARKKRERERFRSMHCVN